MTTGTIYCDDSRLSYVLWHIWDKTRELLLIIGTNGSNCEGSNLARCKVIARKSGYGGFYLLELPETGSQNPFLTDLTERFNNILLLKNGTVRAVDPFCRISDLLE